MILLDDPLSFNPVDENLQQQSLKEFKKLIKEYKKTNTKNIMVIMSKFSDNLQDE